MQTELVAITHVLLYSSIHGVGPVTIHNDSKSALQALQQTTVAENKALLVHLKHLLLLHKFDIKTAGDSQLDTQSHWYSRK